MAAVRARAAQRPQSAWIVLLCVAAWAIPGAGHLWQGRRLKGVVLLVTLSVMFVLGLAIEGRIFPLAPGSSWDILASLMGFSELGIGVLYFIARTLGAGEGRVLAVTYEYGNAFMIAAGLLNLLVVIDTYDIALGRK